MTAIVADTGAMTVRHLRTLIRQPWFVAISLVQPVIWLLIFGALFERVVDVPGFGSDDYIAFLTPGVVVMTALFSGGWLGMSLIEDYERGVLDRFLVTPARRGSLIGGPLAYQAVTTVVQSVIVVGLALAAGADLSGGVAGIAVLIVASILLAGAFGALSCAVGLLARQRETLIGAVQLVILPLTFLSSGLMPANLLPAWVQDVADYNPVNWAVEAGREAMSADVDWSLVLSRCGLLVALVAVSSWLATRAFRAYQRSL
jgi:ABC-2 type transport system permease protein